MSLDKNDIIMIFGNNAQTFASLEELKAVLNGGGSGGAVADDPDFKVLVGRVDELDNNVIGKVDKPVGLKEGDVLQYVGGKFIGVQPDQLAGGA